MQFFIEYRVDGEFARREVEDQKALDEAVRQFSTTKRTGVVSWEAEMNTGQEDEKGNPVTTVTTFIIPLDKVDVVRAFTLPDEKVYTDGEFEPVEE